MNHDSTAASSPTAAPETEAPQAEAPPAVPAAPTTSSLRAWGIDWGMVLIISACCHVIAVCGLILYHGGMLPAGEAVLRTLRMHASQPMRAAMDSEDVTLDDELMEELEETIEYELSEQEIVAESPVIRDEVATDNDLPFEESFGESEGLSDAPFEGPAMSGTVGVGGGAGGSFAGRGGGRNGGVGSGGRARRSWQRSPLANHRLRLKVGKDKTLPIKGVHASVRVDGFRARVVLDCYFQNDTAQTLDGTFQVRLPEGASPHFLAFGGMRLSTPLRAANGKPAMSVDIDALMRDRAETWNQPREARMVPRQRAAHAYKEVVRRTGNPDPALLEWTGTGVFHTRVFPLEAHRLHRIVLGYDVDLIEQGDALAYHLDLPDEVPELLVDLEVRDPKAQVTPAARGHKGRYRWWNPAERHFEVRVPRTATQLLRGSDASGDYFALRVEPDVPNEATPGAERAVFLLDTSLSSGPDAYPIWLAMLERILAEGRGSLKSFALMAFDVQTTWQKPTFVANTPENVRAALTWARGRTLEGATNLGQALTEATRLDGAYDVFLLSDGNATWGPSDERELTEALGAKHTLFAYRTGVGSSNQSLLSRLAVATRGGVFAVTGPDDVPAAARAHTRRPWRLETTDLAGGSDLLVKGDPTWVYPGQVLRVVGRGRPTVEDHFRISLRRGDKQRLLRFTVAGLIDSDLTPRAYGEVALGSLEQTLGVAEEARMAYASHFRVVGTSCSLLMLENEAEYERFGFKAGGHAERVRSTPTEPLVLAAADAAMASAKDPSFLRWLDGLNAKSHAVVRLPKGLREAAAALPPEVFRMRLKTLRCRVLTLDGTSEDWQRRLATGALTAETVRVEAKRRGGSGDDTLRLLSTLVEQAGGDLNVVREVAEEVAALGYGSHALHLWQRVVDRRPLEAHGFARMGRAFTVAGKPEAAILCYETALGQTAPSRRGSFRRATQFEYVHLLSRIEQGSVPCQLGDYARERLGALSFEMGMHEADVVVVLGWNTDRTDVDLHIDDPRGEHCYYSAPKTAMGGRLSTDVTDGYGPEIFVLPKADAGLYRIGVKYYSGDQRRYREGVAVNLVMYRNWGRPNVSVERRTVTLNKRSERVNVHALRVAD